MRLLWVITTCCCAGTALSCPAPPDHSQKLADLFTQAQKAGSDYEGQLISNQMWELWAEAPDQAAQAVLDRGMGKRRSYNFQGALEEFDRLIEYCPNYAEGYNQRAFVNFLREEYELALVDLDRALDLSPTHVAALAGKALTLMGLGRIDEGQAALKQALKLNPWLPERRMLLPPKSDQL